MYIGINFNKYLKWKYANIKILIIHYIVLIPNRLANKLLELSNIDDNGQILEIINLIYI